jgi:hypothetical protein
MGLATIPTFSNAPAPAPTPASNVSRWNAPVSLGATPSSAFAITGSGLNVDSVAADDTWDDDGDLDDLLED